MDTSETQLFIAKRIKDLCNESGISTNQLAARSGLSSSTVRSIMNGECNNPRLRTLGNICKVLSISQRQFWNGESPIKDA